MPESKAQRLISVIRSEFDHCLVQPQKALISTMPIHENDKHVLAAAVCSNAGIIITQNLKDFPPEALAYYQVVAQSPDQFLVNMFYSSRVSVIDVLIRQATSLRNPPMTILELLDRLQLHAPTFADLVREDFD